MSQPLVAGRSSCGGVAVGLRSHGDWRLATHAGHRQAHTSRTTPHTHTRTRAPPLTHRWASGHGWTGRLPVVSLLSPVSCLELGLTARVSIERRDHRPQDDHRHAQPADERAAGSAGTGGASGERIERRPAAAIRTHSGPCLVRAADGFNRRRRTRPVQPCRLHRPSRPVVIRVPLPPSACLTSRLPLPASRLSSARLHRGLLRRRTSQRSQRPPSRRRRGDRDFT